MTDADLYAQIGKTCARVTDIRADVHKKLMNTLSEEKTMAAEAALCEYGVGKFNSHTDGESCSENQEIKKLFFWELDERNRNNQIEDFYVQTVLDTPEITAAAEVLGGPKTFALIRD